MPIQPTAIFTALGMGAGGIVGTFFGNPLAGIQIGGGLGLKVGIANKAEQGIDEVGKKVSEATDSLGRKIEVIIDRTNEKLVAVVERVADTWATIMLCGYTWQIATSAATANKLAMNTVCQSAWESLSCASMEATTLSINTVAIAASTALVFKLFDVYKQSTIRNKA